MKILIVGSFSAWRGDPLASGTVVSLRLLVDELGDRQVEMEVIDTAALRRRRILLPFAVALIGCKLLWKAGGADVITLHLSPNGLSVLGPLAVLVKRVRRRPLIIRLFGGLDYLDIPGIRRRFASFAFSRCDGTLLQTKGLVEAGISRGLGRVKWFPTARRMPPAGEANPHSPEPGRFIFVGQLKRKKGILHLIEASRRLGPRCRTDVFGPFYDDLDERIFTGVANVRYGGTLHPDDVCRELRRAAALVFPTFLDEEGYSGILMEAFSVGLPIICTRWKFLPEFVPRDGAIFCEPDNADALEAAMRRFLENPSWHDTMSEASFAARERFSIDRAADEFLNACAEAKQTFR